MPERYIKRILDGDKEAFRFIIGECQDAAYNLSISILKDDMLAKEAIQKAFIRAYEKLHTFKHRSTFKTWFHRIVVNEAFQLSRKSKNNRNSPHNLPANYESSKNEIQKGIDENHMQHYVHQALDVMKPNECLSLRLFYLEEHSIEEIIDITGWSKSNVKVTLHRARKSMKTILSEKFNMKPEELYL